MLKRLWARFKPRLHFATSERVRCWHWCFGLLMIAVLILPHVSFGIPVEDFGEWIRTAQVSAQEGQQFSQLVKQYEMLREQYAALQEANNSLTGNYGWGSFDNSASDLKTQHEWAPSSWKAALAGEAGGNPGRYQQLLSQYKAAHPSLSPQHFAAGRDKNLSSVYEQQVKSIQVSSVNASYEFNSINQHMKSLYALSQQIANAQKNHNLKSAVDLNSRIQLEIGYISVEELRMQALMNEQIASRQNHQIALENEGAEFNAAP